MSENFYDVALEVRFTRSHDGWVMSDLTIEPAIPGNTLAAIGELLAGVGATHGPHPVRGGYYHPTAPPRSET